MASVKKILIFGSSGMIGHVILNHLTVTKRYHVIGSATTEDQNNSQYRVDVRDPIKVENCLRDVNPDIVINCAGLLIAESEKTRGDAILINSFFPHLLSRLGDKLNYRLIHISTDCVYSGEKGGYSESSSPDGESVYARTKALGELINQADLIVRTSAIGPELKSEGSGLLSWFLKQKGEIEGFTHAFWTGVTTLELAKGIDSFITQELSGIYNFVPQDKISKYELLLLIKKVWKKENVQILPKKEPENDKSLINSRRDLNFTVKNYEEMLYELRKYIQSNSTSYSDYQ
ncbi:MAG: SDR family oxidoreductase [Flavobacteriales bacterium]|nr:SDR family oxidoreductase [Flavobacteriales bacterium]